MTTYLFFCCPDCGEPTTVRQSYDKLTYRRRVRECPNCGEFRTRAAPGEGAPEVFEFFLADPLPEPDDDDDIEPLELEPMTPAVAIMELWTSVKLRSIWEATTYDYNGNGRNGKRPQVLRGGGNGYVIDSERKFYNE
jgi:hypothetical protein